MRESVNSLFRRLFCMFGIQVVPLAAHQKELLKNYPSLRYRHVIARPLKNRLDFRFYDFVNFFEQRR